MNVKPGEWYKGKNLGEFELIRIRNINGKPIFVCRTVNMEDGIELSLDEMRQENPRLI